MPTSDTCPIILVSNHFNYLYRIENVETRNVIFVLTKEYEGIEIWKGKVICYFIDEVKLINKEFELIKENDVVCTFNGNNFDIPYITERARVLRMKNLNVGNADKSIYCHKHLSKGFSVTSIRNVYGKIVIDILAILKREDATNVFLKAYNLKKLTLEHVSKEILGLEKLEFPVEDMVKYWNNTNDIELRNKFIEYCSRDSQLALEFLTRFRLLDKFVALSKVSGKLVQDVINSMGSGIMVENILLQEFRKEDRVIPIRMGSGSSYKNDDEELKGAFVMVKELGVIDYLCSLDYSALYPSLIIKYNLCYTTLVTESDLSKLGLTDSDVEVQKDEYGSPYATFVKKEKYVGIMPRMLKRVLDARAVAKKEMKKHKKDSSEYLLYDSSQNAFKIVANSVYGYSGDSLSKVYSWYVASAVTTNGRLQIRKTIEMINRLEVKKDNVNYLLDVKMTDTDSTYVSVTKMDGNIRSKDLVTREECVWAVNYAAEAVNKTLEKPMNLAYENFIRRIVIVAKKHYAMLTVDDDGKEGITTKGMEIVRREWSNFASNNMSKAIDFILKEKKLEDGIKKSVELVKEQAKLLNDGKIDLNDLVLSKKLTKPITHYDNLQVHVQVAIKMKERGRPSEVGDRIQFFILNNGKKLISEKAEEADYVFKNRDKCRIDYGYYLYSQLLPPLIGSNTRKGVLELLGVRKDELISKLDTNQRSLFEF